MFLFFLIEFALGGPDPKLSDTPTSITQFLIHQPNKKLTSYACSSPKPSMSSYHGVDKLKAS